MFVSGTQHSSMFELLCTVSPSFSRAMSVFQLQEWWGVQLSQDEEFDHGCMVVGNIDNAEPATEKIAVGSLQGMLRIYSPTRPQFRVEDLILEESLGAPILQLLLGRFIPASNMLGLAVLHPKRLVVYELIPQSNKDGRVNFYSLRRAYAHDLGVDGKHFTAYNMNSGCFGGSRDREMIVVQSLDGKLQIFEQSANAFTRQIADCLLPGPVAYVPKVDAFVTVNHACQAECYRYQVLASSSSDIGSKDVDAKGTGAGSNGLRSIRSAMVEWSLHIGEPCRQILEGHFSGAGAGNNSPNPDGYANPSRRAAQPQSELLVLCDKSVFLLKAETGGLIQQKRLERADASCMCAIPASLGGTSGGGSSGNFMLAGQDATVQVYSGFNLVWAAKVPTVPVQMAVSSFGNQKGLIVCMDDSGMLTVNYLGTKPPMNSVMKQVRELDYDLVESEHRALLQVIRDSQSENRVEVTDKLFIRPQYPKSVENESPAGVSLPSASLVPLFAGVGANNGGNDGPYVKILVRLYLSYSADKPATNVSLSIDGPGFVHIVPKNIILSKVAGVKKTPLMVKVFLYATKASLPLGLEAVVTASYTSHNGEPRVTSIPLTLPLFLACKPKAPVKAAQCKVVLDTEQHPAQPLTELFGDFLYAYQTAGIDVAEALGSNATQAMGFQLFAPVVDNVSLGLPAASVTAATGAASAPAVVSILVSKNAGRYRVQADSVPALALVVDELERRLSVKLTGPANATAIPPPPPADAVSIVKCAEPLPLEQYFTVIAAHFQARVKIAELSAQLNDVAHQYRMVEKRLLVRYKDRNPTPLSGLDALMRETYNRLLTISDKVEEQQGVVSRCFTELEGYSRFLATMAALKYGLSYGERALLRSYLCPDIKEGSEQGWEETVNASVTFLLKTTLAKTAKEGTSSLSGTTLELPSSIDTLKKHLLLLFDRLEKGSRLIVPSSTTPSTSAGAVSGAAGGNSASEAAMPKSKSSKSAGGSVNSRVDTKQAK